MCAWKASGVVLLAKPPLVVANVACRAWETFCASCHSFPLSLSGSANGDINQSADTHAEAVMCHHAGVSCDRQRWMTHPDAGNILNTRIISWYNSSRAQHWMNLFSVFWWKNLMKLRGPAGEGPSLRCFISTDMIFRVMLQIKMMTMIPVLLLVDSCRFRSTSYRSRSCSGRETPEPITGLQTG